MFWCTYPEVVLDEDGELVVNVARHPEVGPVAVPLGGAGADPVGVHPDRFRQVDAVRGGDGHDVRFVVPDVVPDVLAGRVHLVHAGGDVVQGRVEDHRPVGQDGRPDEDHADGRRGRGDLGCSGTRGFRPVPGHALKLTNCRNN